MDERVALLVALFVFLAAAFGGESSAAEEADGGLQDE